MVFKSSAQRKAVMAKMNNKKRCTPITTSPNITLINKQTPNDKVIFSKKNWRANI